MSKYSRSGGEDGAFVSVLLGGPSGIELPDGAPRYGRPYGSTAMEKTGPTPKPTYGRGDAGSSSSDDDDDDDDEAPAAPVTHWKARTLERNAAWANQDFRPPTWAREALPDGFRLGPARDAGVHDARERWLRLRREKKPAREVEDARADFLRLEEEHLRRVRQSFRDVRFYEPAVAGISSQILTDAQAGLAAQAMEDREDDDDDDDFLAAIDRIRARREDENAENQMALDTCVVCGGSTRLPTGEDMAEVLFCLGEGCDGTACCHLACSGLLEMPHRPWFCPACEAHDDESGAGT